MRHWRFPCSFKMKLPVFGNGFWPIVDERHIRKWCIGEIWFYKTDQYRPWIFIINFFVIFLVTTNEVFGAENLASIDKEIEEKLLSRCKNIKLGFGP